MIAMDRRYFLRLTAGAAAVDCVACVAATRVNPAATMADVIERAMNERRSSDMNDSSRPP